MMHKVRPLDALMPATRQGILAATLLHPEKWWYLSDLANHLGVPPSSLQRELPNLVRAGILESQRDGNRVYFRPATDCPFIAELTGLMVKTAGVFDVVRDSLRPFKNRIRCAFVYGSVARGDFRPDSDVDLMVIGNVGLSDLTKPLKRVEDQLGRTINPTVYPQEELAQKIASGHHFLTTVLKEPKLFLVGNQDELDQITKHRSRARARHKQERA